MSIYHENANDVVTQQGAECAGVRPPGLPTTSGPGLVVPALPGDVDFATYVEEISINSIPILPAAPEVRTHTAATGLMATKNVGSVNTSVP